MHLSSYSEDGSGIHVGNFRLGSTALPIAKLDVKGDLAINSMSPSALSAGNNNDYAGANGCSFARLSGDAVGTSTVTGIAAGSDGRLLILINVSANNVTITHQDVASSAGNRIITAAGASVVLTADDVVVFLYDSTTLRWRQVVGLV
jgi:hypothetical protein